MYIDRQNEKNIKNAKLSTEERARAIGMLESGISILLVYTPLLANHPLSAQTVRNRLKMVGLLSRM